MGGRAGAAQTAAASLPAEAGASHTIGTKVDHEDAPRPGDILDAMALTSGQRLLRYDRRLGARFVAGVDEAGRGSLAGPLVVAGVLLDYESSARPPRSRPLALLNDSKQVTRRSGRSCFARSSGARPDRRAGVLRRARSTATGCTARTSRARVVPRRALTAGGGVRGRRLPPRPERATAPRDRRRRHEERGDRGSLDRREGGARSRHAPDGRALPALRVLLARRLHHAEPLCGRPCARAVAHPRRSLRRTATATVPETGVGTASRAPRGPALPAARLPRSSATNVWSAGYELDLIVRRGRRAHVLRGQVEVGDRGSAARSRWSIGEKRRRRPRGSGSLARRAIRASVSSGSRSTSSPWTRASFAGGDP